MKTVIAALAVALVLTAEGCTAEGNNKTTGVSGPVVAWQNSSHGGIWSGEVLVDFGVNGHVRESWRSVTRTQYNQCAKQGAQYPDCTKKVER